MRRAISARCETFRLKKAFRISRSIRTTLDVVTVTIEADGHVGRGEATPNPRYGETVDDTLVAIREMSAAVLAGASRDEIADAMPGNPARNALDCALWDLESRIAGRSISALTGIPALSGMATALTIGLDTPEAMANSARVLKDAPLLKLKLNAVDPAARIRAVRAAAPAARLIVDANESWSFADVERLQEVMAEAGVELLEQPLPADRDHELEGFRPLVPIAADEAARGIGNVGQLASRYQFVNLKPTNAGGLTAALVLAKEAQRLGIGIMSGCPICTSLTVAPALSIAAQASVVDLDGPLWLAKDRDGGVEIRNGTLSPPSRGFWGA